MKNTTSVVKKINAREYRDFVFSLCNSGMEIILISSTTPHGYFSRNNLDHFWRFSVTLVKIQAKVHSQSKRTTNSFVSLQTVYLAVHNQIISVYIFILNIKQEYFTHCSHFFISQYRTTESSAFTLLLNLILCQHLKVANIN